MARGAAGGRATLIVATVAVAVSACPPAFAAGRDRPMGRVFDWGHELRQERLPAWNARTAPPIVPRRWYAIVDATLRRAGANALWFSGYNGLPFDIPVHPKEPRAWRNPAVFARAHRATGLSWDVNVEARAAHLAFARGWATAVDRAATAPTRRLSLLDPGYERAALAEIRRIVPRHAKLPYVFAYTGSDEPVAVLPRGPAERSAFARTLRAQVASRYGWAPPRASARPTRSVIEGLRWGAYSRFASDRFFAMKERQAALVHRLDPGARVVPNDYLFLDGFLPWDYTRLGRFADIVEADPYVSLEERRTPGRGRYNHGFAAKLLSDLTGKPVRIVVQAFPYAGYRPTPEDLGRWTAQALRAGATHISFYALGNPRFTDPPFYARMLAIARRLRGTRLPTPPTDPATLVVYATASEGMAQPHLSGERRYRTSGDALYTTYALLGELAKGSFSFEADTRLLAQPSRLARARLLWMPRADTLDRAFAEQVLGWVRSGGTLILTDPSGFTRAPDGGSLAPIRDALVGAPLGPAELNSTIVIAPGVLGGLVPAGSLSIPITSRTRRAFAAVPFDANVVARFGDGMPAVISRTVGAGRVIAFASDLMAPRALVRPGDLPAFVAAMQTAGGGSLGDPAWDYRVP